MFRQQWQPCDIRSSCCATSAMAGVRHPQWRLFDMSNGGFSTSAARRDHPAGNRIIAMGLTGTYCQ